METVRAPTIAAGCALVVVATSTYYGSQAATDSKPTAQTVRLAGAGDGFSQVRPRPELQRGVSALEKHEGIKAMLAAAARARDLDPGLVMAVGWWESGWDMSKVSDTGAIGIMQIDPATAQDLGPKLLGRPVDPRLTADNIALGAAVLSADVRDSGGDVNVALASYYEGGGNVDPSNLDPNAQAYIAGVRALQQQFDAGQDPSA